MNAESRVDLIILGGGMTGATLALALAGMTQRLGRPARVLLLDAQRPATMQHPGFDRRAIALSLGSERALRDWQLWPVFAPGCGTIRQVHVSDRGHFGQTLIQADDYDVPALGRVVELFPVGQRLLQRLEQHANITYLAPAKVIDIEHEPDAVLITLEDGSRVRGSLLVLADGGHSGWPQQLGYHYDSHDFGTAALITHLHTSRTPAGVAWERFTEHGPLALLPLGDNQLTLVWSLPPAEAGRLQAMAEPDFLRALQQAFGYRAGLFRQCGPREVYPLVMRQATSRCQGRTLLLGNAAQLLHPVAGQGFNLAMRDIQTLLELWMAAWQAGDDPGAPSVLQGYALAREPDVATTLWLTRSLATLFASQAGPLVLARNAALGILNHLPALRYPLAAQLMGPGRRATDDNWS